MSYNSESLNENGEGMCISCRKKFPLHQLETCEVCQRFVCKSCAVYRRQGYPYGYVCKSCARKLDDSKE